ncbi:MAG TPA: rod shape-determining protein MreD [Geminicoccus sp.]|uniref:rod shape-determining protein MreD n=1 Tax=Geminicoccus sp. TaxID=2024832 RepID=UPI002B9FBC84|nr:rod shape-determining protein MreD [Geminicoccus sp.]HWL72013.1 rod shape-determining protein MreD [Geminicoccus sp.]
MTGLITHKAELRLRQLLPILTVALALLLDLAPLPDAGPQAQAPKLVFAVVFFWALHRPELLPPLALFLLGLAGDLVAGSLVGLGPAMLLLLREAVARQQRFLLAASPLGRWVGFAGYVAVMMVAVWLVTSAHALRWQAIDPLAVQALLTVLAWPVVAVLLIQVHARLPRVRHAAGG